MKYLNKKSFFILLLIVVFTLILRWQSWTILLDRDEGTYAYIAAHLFDNDFLPYKNAFDHKPPGIYVIYGVFMQFLGKELLAIKVAGFVNSVISTIVFLFILKEIKIERTKRLFYTFLYMVLINSMLFDGLADNTEVYMATALGAMLWLFLKFMDNSPNKHRYLLLSGVFGGLAFHIKHVAVFNMIALAIWLLIYKRKKYKRLLTIYFSGFSIVFLSTILYFQANDALDYYWEAVYLFNYKYLSGGFSSINSVKNLINLFFHYPSHVLFLVVIFVFLLFFNARRLRNRNIFLFSVWAIFSLISAKILVRDSSHYFFSFMHGFILFAVAISDDVRSSVLLKIVGVYFVITTITVLILPPNTMLAELKGDRNVTVKYWMLDLAEKIQNTTTSEDKVMITFMESPQTLFYAKRKSSTRFLYSQGKAFPTFEEELRNSLADTKIVIGKKDWIDRYIGVNFEELGFIESDYDINKDILMIRRAN